MNKYAPVAALLWFTSLISGGSIGYHWGRSDGRTEVANHDSLWSAAYARDTALLVEMLDKSNEHLSTQMRINNPTAYNPVIFSDTLLIIAPKHDPPVFLCRQMPKGIEVYLLKRMEKGEAKGFRLPFFNPDTTYTISGKITRSPFQRGYLDHALIYNADGTVSAVYVDSTHTWVEGEIK